MHNRNTGFTLIELLVVITVIGILSSIVFSYLQSAKGKGTDTKVKSQLAQIRSAAELFYNNNNSYNGSAGNISGPCTTNNSMFVDTTSKMDKIISGLPTGATATCYSTAGAYAVSALLPGAGGTNSWCVDSQGASQLRATAITTTTC